MRLVESALSNDGPGSEITPSKFSSGGLLNKLGDPAEKAVDKGGETGKKDTRDAKISRKKHDRAKEAAAKGKARQEE